eukprot:9094996-Prorocentrum_lima.AAC.1
MQAYTNNIIAYSGTAAKWTQRAIYAFAAHTGYMLFSMDICSALLKEMTFAETVFHKLMSGSCASYQEC